MTIAEEDHKQKETHFRDLVYGLLDLSMAMLLFLPFFAAKADGMIKSVSLIDLDGIRLYVKAAYLAVVVGMIITGVRTLSLQGCQARAWLKSKPLLRSMSLS